MVVADPDLGPVQLRDVSAAELAQLYVDIDGVDLEQLAGVLDVVEGRDDGDEDMPPTERVRTALVMHAFVRAAVVDPVPPSLAPDGRDYPALRVLIDTQRWPSATITRIFDRLMEEVAAWTPSPS